MSIERITEEAVIEAIQRTGVSMTLNDIRQALHANSVPEYNVMRVVVTRLTNRDVLTLVHERRNTTDVRAYVITSKPAHKPFGDFEGVLKSFQEVARIRTINGSYQC